LRRVLSYFGLDGTASRQQWVLAAIHTLPPLVLSALVEFLDGLTGLAGIAAWLASAVLFYVAWSLVLARFPPWRRAYGRLQDSSGPR
jgi:hypothetical protein